jgi:hypothetical protein
MIKPMKINVSIHININRYMCKNIMILFGIFCSVGTAISQSYNDSMYIQKKIETHPRISRLSNWNILYDFEKDFFGRLSLDLSGMAEGDTVVVYIGEKLDPSGKIDRNPGGTIRSYRYRISKAQNRDQLFLPDQPDKRNTTGNALRLPAFMGILAPFRYVELESSKHADKIRVSREIFHYRFNDQASSFKSSDSVLNAIWDLCKHSIKATSFMGLYIDGDRERIPYEADALINQLSHYALDTEYEIARNTFEYLMLHPTWPTEWHLQMHQIAWYDYLYTGNVALIKKYYDLLGLKTLDAFRQPNGLISTTAVPQRLGFLDSIHYKTFDAKQGLRDITDWPQKGNKIAGPNYPGESDGFVFCSYNSVVNAYYYKSLLLMKEFARILEKKEDMILYDQKAREVYKVFNEVFVDPVTGLIKDGDTTTHSSFHANFFALCFGLISDQHKKAVKNFLISKDMACSVYGSQFFMDALYNEGMGEHALKMLTKKDERSWYHMLELGAGMTMEAWDIKFKPNLDWNHAWGAAPSNIIAFRMMGIQPSRPGFTEAMIRPEIGNLTMAELRLPTAEGEIYEKIIQDEDHYNLELWLPRNMKARICLPVFSTAIRNIRMNGRKVKPIVTDNKYILENLEGAITITIKK